MQVQVEIIELFLQSCLQHINAETFLFITSQKWFISFTSVQQRGQRRPQNSAVSVTPAWYNVWSNFWFCLCSLLKSQSLEFGKLCLKGCTWSATAFVLCQPLITSSRQMSAPLDLFVRLSRIQEFCDSSWVCSFIFYFSDDRIHTTLVHRDIVPLTTVMCGYPRWFFSDPSHLWSGAVLHFFFIAE